MMLNNQLIHINLMNPENTTYPEFSGLPEKESEYEHNSKYVEALFTETFTYMGITYKIEIPMYED